MDVSRPFRRSNLPGERCLGRVDEVFGITLLHLHIPTQGPETKLVMEYMSQLEPGIIFTDFSDS